MLCAAPLAREVGDNLCVGVQLLAVDVVAVDVCVGSLERVAEAVAAQKAAILQIYLATCGAVCHLAILLRCRECVLGICCLILIEAILIGVSERRSVLDVVEPTLVDVECTLGVQTETILLLQCVAVVVGVAGCGTALVAVDTYRCSGVGVPLADGVGVTELTVCTLVV